MFGLNYRIFWKVIVITSLLSPFVLFSTGMLPGGQGNIVGRVAKEVMYPLEGAWHFSLKFFADIWTHYVDLSDAAIENTELKSALAILNTRILDYDEKVKEIERLRKILGFTQHYRSEHQVAEVIGSPKDIPFEVLRISKGSMDGVRVGMPVITGEGALGRILRTGSFHSDVQLLTDANFYLDVLLQRTRARGVLRGEFGMSCSLKLNRRAEVRIGDTLITSGIVGGFPKGIPIGRVIRVSYESDNITQIIKVEPWVNHFQVEEVVILKTINDETQKIINTAGEAWLKQTIESASRSDG